MTPSRASRSPLPTAPRSTAFDVLTSGDALIVVEDDMLFSPDLMDFFLAGYHVMRGDRTLWCVSAWNDNGFRGMVNARAARRAPTDGLLPRAELAAHEEALQGRARGRVAVQHWDHWMRSERVHRTSKGRECLYPHVPRAFHHGAVGTFMTKLNHAEASPTSPRPTTASRGRTPRRRSPASSRPRRTRRGSGAAEGGGAPRRLCALAPRLSPHSGGGGRRRAGRRGGRGGGGGGGDGGDLVRHAPAQHG